AVPAAACAVLVARTADAASAPPGGTGHRCPSASRSPRHARTPEAGTVGWERTRRERGGTSRGLAWLPVIDTSGPTGFRPIVRRLIPLALVFLAVGLALAMASPFLALFL